MKIALSTNQFSPAAGQHDATGSRALVPSLCVMGCLGLMTLLLQQGSRQHHGREFSASGIPLAAVESHRTATVGSDAYRIRMWTETDDLPRRIAVFETVFWEPDDTRSLRQLIRASDFVRGKEILEIGTGSGLLPLCCLQAGASRVVATDVNPAAVANAVHNARLLGLSERLEVRQVPLDDTGAYSVIDPDERFDLIISNPPWEDQEPASIAEFALYDPNFELLRSILSGMREHLTEGGRAWLAYGCREAIEKLIDLAPRHGLKVTILDSRRVEDLPDVFLPGMLLEVKPE